MTTRSVSWRFVSATLVLNAGLFLAPPVIAEEQLPASTEGPILIARRAPEATPATYDLRYKLKRGDVLRYEVTDRASFNTTIEQSTSAAQTKTVTIKAWKIIDVLPNGNIEFMNVIERVKMINQLPDREAIEYDSERDATPAPGFEDVAQSIGVPLLAVVMTPHGEVIRRNWKTRGPRAEDNAPIAVRLPDEPIAVGDTWDEPYDVPVALEDQTKKTIQTRRHHKLLDVANGIARIEVSYQVLSPIDAFIEYQLVQRLMHGEVRFDIKAGRVVSQQMEIDKRILGFAGPTSSTHYVMQMEEKLLKQEPKVAANRSDKSTSSRTAPPAKPAGSASRSRSPRGTRGYRR
jgi:hypothetical protein